MCPIQSKNVKKETNPPAYCSHSFDGCHVFYLFKNHKFDEVAIEDIFFAYNPKTVLKLAQFRGALSLKILQLHGDFVEYTPLQVKKTVTGKAKADKEQVAFMVKKILGITKEIKPLDVTDAIAIALTHANNLRVK